MAVGGGRAGDRGGDLREGIGVLAEDKVPGGEPHAVVTGLVLEPSLVAGVRLEQPLWSPNADEFWDWTEKYIVEYAKMSAENRHLMGVFLDYENYAPGRTGNLYSLSYDDVILRKFAGARGLDLPELDGAARKPWLDEQGLHEAFEAFQVAHWRERCRHLRQRVDEHDPTFQFCIYPAPGTPFMIQATYPEWATPRAPIILADASTYGRPARYLPERESLERNRQLLIERLQTAKDAAVPFIYAGGIDPVVRGADPEFCGKNAVAITSAFGVRARTT